MIIMGIDPGFAITGYGIIKYEGNRFTVLEYDAIITKPSEKFAERLLTLNNRIKKLINIYRPEAFSIEELFFNKNVKTAITAAQGRGAAMVAAAECGISIYEYTPLQVKQAVVGYGRAEKSQIQQMVKVILNLPEIPKPDDVADALAIAICHAHSYKMENIAKCQEAKDK
ncbi:MAG TPA: crossover junction endodeoxyribonuclease RuvC [Clostridiales bacterium]|nr:crossover junction endodeoxyribonuclease RuvC [Clostridiales bacterium]